MDTAGFDYAGKSSLAFGFVLGASNARYSNLVEEGGRLELVPPPGSVDTLYEHLRALEGSQCALSTGHSGLTIYDVEIRGGAPAGLSCGAISGAASSDPIVFERVYAHRSFPALGGVAACGGGTTWDCASHSFKPCASCENQDVRLWASPAVKMGDETNDNATDHIVVRNSVLELASDGWGIFHGSGGKDVWFVNNTFGNAHRTDDGLKAILGSAGANGNWGAKLYNNLFVLGGATQGGIRYLGIRGEIASDYNLFMPFGASGSTRIWNAGETLESVITTEGQETHSALVCASGCAGAQGTYFNDSGESGLVDPSLLDGTPADYTPKATFRGIDIGANAWCPEEDFLGLPRDDGHCDIGALEWRASPPGPDAGAPEADSSVLLEDGSVVATGDAAMDYGDGGLESGDAAGQAGDGGLVVADASTAVSGDGAVRGDAGGAAVPKGCGCGSAGGVMMPLGALLGLGLCRRTRRRG